MARNEFATIQMTAQSQAIVKRLKGSDVMPDLRREMRAATQPLQPAARQAARRLPSQRRRTKVDSLRTAIANAITRKLKLSQRQVLVAIVAIPKGGKSNLARALEGEIPWEHPTYGHDPIVTQEAHPFFKKTLDKYEPSVTRAIEGVLTKFERRL